MAKIDKSIMINAPSDKVWELLYWDRLPEWLETIKRAEYTSTEKDGVGATAHVIAETAGVNAEWDVEITEYIKNEKATWRTTAGNFTAIGLTTLTPAEDGVKLTFLIDYELPYRILGQIIDKLMTSKEIEEDIARGLEKLKNILEK